jgi:hypothetical protein
MGGFSQTSRTTQHWFTSNYKEKERKNPRRWREKRSPMG